MRSYIAGAGGWVQHGQFACGGGDDVTRGEVSIDVDARTDSTADISARDHMNGPVSVRVGFDQGEFTDSYDYHTYPCAPTVHVIIPMFAKRMWVQPADPTGTSTGCHDTVSTSGTVTAVVWADRRSDPEPESN